MHGAVDQDDEGDDDLGEEDSLRGRRATASVNTPPSALSSVKHYFAAGNPQLSAFPLLLFTLHLSWAMLLFASWRFKLCLLRSPFV